MDPFVRSKLSMELLFWRHSQQDKETFLSQSISWGFMDADILVIADESNDYSQANGRGTCRA
jgi:hypothetical protein